MRMTTMQQQLAGAFGALSLLAVAVTSIVSAGVAIDGRDRERAETLRHLVETLATSSFPIRERVLKQIQGMTGADLVAVNVAGETRAATVALTDMQRQELLRLASPLEDVTRISTLPTFKANGRLWRTAVASVRSIEGPVRLVVLYPDERWRQAWREAVLVPTVLGVVTGGITLLVSAWVARSFSRRIHRVQDHVAQLGRRDYSQTSLTGPPDEIYELHAAVNDLALRLETLEEEISRSERMHMLGRLAAGLAHQNRNSIAGARMAVQLHQRRCSGSGQDESLTVALRQLELTEHQLRGLVAVAAGHTGETTPGDLQTILDDTLSLTLPYRLHMRTRFSEQREQVTKFCVEDSDGVRTAVLNVLTNAVEAAGPGGQVSLAAAPEGVGVIIHISDSGSGPAEEVAARLFEPFLTTKREGVGIGLAYAQQIVTRLGGTLTWKRQGGQTVFSIFIPGHEPQNEIKRLGRPRAETVT